MNLYLHSTIFNFKTELVFYKRIFHDQILEMINRKILQEFSTLQIL